MPDIAVQETTTHTQQSAAQESTAEDAHVTSADPLTPENVSRMTTLALAADLEFWARTASVGGHVGLNDLVHVLDVIRDDCAPDAHESP